MGYVYKITNTVNQKSYIGISLHEPEKGRIREHFAGRGNRYLANAVRKYGRDIFICEILEENVFPELLPDLEMTYIKKYNTVSPHGYNLTHGGEINKKPSEETREKMSRAQRGKTLSKEAREKISRANRGRPSPNKGKAGKPHSKETRERMSRAKRGKPSSNKGKSHSKETRERMSRAQRGKTLSKEAREKISRALCGNSPSKTHREKISRANRGKSRSKETREKMSRAQRGKSHSKETREKMSRAQRGKSFSKTHREKISRANRSPDRIPAREFFLSLPSGMSLREKRRLLRKKFPERGQSTIYLWTNEWIQDS